MRWICDFKNGVQSQKGNGFSTQLLQHASFFQSDYMNSAAYKANVLAGFGPVSGRLGYLTKLPNQTFQLGLALSWHCFETRRGPAHSCVSARIGGGAGTISYSSRGRLSKAGVMSPGVTFCPMTTCANRTQASIV